MTAAAVRKALRAQADPVRAANLARFFKTGPGQYGEGDRFIGVTVPTQRVIARRFRDLPIVEADTLLTSPIHEERLTALLILVDRFTRSADPRVRERIFRLYRRRLRFIDNWDLVDTSAAPIVGGWLAWTREARPVRATGSTRSRRRGTAGVRLDDPDDLLERLARSTHLWSRRVAMIATSYFIVRGEHADAIRIATILVDDEHDLIQKAVGWMLREVGKRADPDALTRFLTEHAATMPRTALRYAIERLPPPERRQWMGLRNA